MQGGVASGEAHVGSRRRKQSRLVALPGVADRRTDLLVQARKSGLGEGVEERLAVSEVAARRRVAHPCLAGEVAQRQGLDALLAERALGLGEQRGAQSAVVVGAIRHVIHAINDVVIDITVVADYIVVYDYFHCRERPPA